MSSEDGSRNYSERKSFIGRIKSAFAKNRGLDSESAEIIETLEQGEADTKEQREMLAKVVGFDKLTVGDVMVPRADILALDVETPLGEVIRIFNDYQHSRLPIYMDNLDNPLGFAHVKDVISLLSPDENGNLECHFDEKILSKIKRELVYAPLSMRLPNLLLQMRAKRCHMAIAVDEYGGTDGLITIEDLVEQIVGDIDDEYDNNLTETIISKGNNQWEVDAKLLLDEFIEKTNVNIKIDEEIEVDTIGGLAFFFAGRVPPRGEIIDSDIGLEFEILDADPRKIKRMIVRIIDNSQENPSNESEEKN